MTTSCLFGNTRYPAEGVTETAVTALTMPANVLQHVLQHSAAFRGFLSRSFATHLASVSSLLEEVAFGRLARQLLDRSDSGRVVRATHRLLATEPGSAREVFSRLLKELEVQGWLELQRGSIHIPDRAALQRLDAR